MHSKRRSPRSDSARHRLLVSHSGADAFDEDASVRSHLAALGPEALNELRRVLEAPEVRSLPTRASGCVDLGRLRELAFAEHLVSPLMGDGEVGSDVGDAKGAALTHRPED